MLVGDTLGCGCSGAGASLAKFSAFDVADNMRVTTEVNMGMVTPDDLLTVPESTWNPGATAYLFAPFPVNAGQWQSDQMVNQFVKNQDGRWYSDPGADVHYPDLMALALAAPIRYVDNPEPVKVIDTVIVSPESPLPSAPVDLQKLAVEGEGVQFATEIGVEVPVSTVGLEDTPIVTVAKGIPWWVWLAGGAATIYALTRK